MDRQASNLLHGGGEGRSGSGGGGGGAAAVGRPSGVRWTPTSEQIRILRELYYGCGIRSPNAEQIQRIAARLRQYGRIEGKNVFYWFQNHKARERQKKRLTTLDITTSAAAAAAAGINHLALLSLSPSGAAAASSGGALCYAGNGASAVQLEASTNCWDTTTAMDTERSFLQLQDYMGVRSTGGHAGTGVAAAPWEACFPVDQPSPPPPITRELPLFPTDGRHGGEGSSQFSHRHHQESGSYLQQPNNNFQSWDTVQQHHHHHQLQQQQQHSFCSNQLPSSQEAEGTSLELTLSAPTVHLTQLQGRCERELCSCCHNF